MRKCAHQVYLRRRVGCRVWRKNQQIRRQHRGVHFLHPKLLRVSYLRLVVDDVHGAALGGFLIDDRDRFRRLGQGDEIARLKHSREQQRTGGET